MTNPQAAGFPATSSATPPETADVAATVSQVGGSIETSLSAAAANVQTPPTGPAAGTALPESFGRYKIERELGKGAMGVVYLAQDTQLDRQVALKIPRPAVLEEPDALERFYREAKTTSKIRHPNICPVFDVGAIDGTHYLTMAYIPGKPISSFLGKEKLPAAKQVALLIRKIALALDEAHRLGVVHRDLKPANIMLDDRNEPIVMDFGLACQTNTAEQARLTQSGAILGTPAYMAPEQVAGDSKEIGPQSDVYALGVMMYQFLTGELPFNGPIMTVFAQILRDQPKRPSMLRPDVDPKLEAICLKMMAKEKSQRYASMKEAAAALTDFLKTGGEAAAGEMKLAEDPAKPKSAPAQTAAPTPPVIAKPQPKASPAVKKAANLSPEQLKDLTELVDQLLIRNDHPEAIRIIEELPEYQRTPRLKSQLGEAYQAMATVEKLERSLEKHLNVLDIPALKKCVDQLLKLRPSHPRGKEIRKALNTEGKQGVVKLLKKDGNYHGGGLAWEWWQIGAAAGCVALIFAVMSFAIFIYLKNPQQTVAIQIDDPTAVVKIDGNIATINAEGIGEMRLSLGEHTYTVEQGGTTVETDGKYEVKRDGKNVLRITVMKSKPGDGIAGNAPPPAVAPFDAAQAKAHQAAWAKHLGVPVEYTNSIGMKFRLIPPGEFLMGSTPEEIEAALKVVGENTQWQEWIKSEAPQHKVILTQPIYLGTYEITQGQYEKVMGTNPSYFAKTGSNTLFSDPVAGMDTSNHPVEGVSWNDAAEFCAKLSLREQLKPFDLRVGKTVAPLEGTGYRLPTEAEWEFAGRGGTVTTFWSGAQDEQLLRADWRIANAGGRTHAVGELKANPFGLYDVHGNVSEWVHDGWDPTFYRQFQEKSAIDPSSPFSDSSQRVVRGGFWYCAPFECRASVRRDAQTLRYQGFGFRVSLTVDAVKTALAAASGAAPPAAIAPFDASQAKAHQAAWAKHLGVPVEYTNSIGMKFRLIPPGEFLMGSTAAEIEAALKDAKDVNAGDKYWQEGIRSEAPQHKVILTQPIYLGVTEVTQGQYEQVMGTNPSWFAKTGAEPQLVEKVAGMDTASHPVENVSWNDAAEFCAKLSQQEKFKPFYFRTGSNTITPLEGTGYRLPSEAEWEFAGRAGTTTKYWIGDQDEDLVRVDWFVTNSGGRTNAVGELKPNPFGLYDIHGNLWEWVQDGWDATYYGQFQEKPAINPNNPFSASSARVHRGGCWLNTASACRSSHRRADDPSSHAGGIGFRVSLTVDAVKTAMQQDSAGLAPSAMPDVKSAAEWVLSKKGKLWIDVGGKEVEVTNAGQPPGDLRQVSRVMLEHEFNDRQKSPIEELDKLAAFQNLTKLDFFECGIKNDGAHHIARLTRLKYLMVNNCQLTEAGVKALAPLTKLEYLDLNHQQFSADALGVLASAMPSLKSLSMYNNTSMTDDGLAHLSALPLTLLSLTGTGISDAGVKHLEKIKTLDALYLAETKVSDASMDILKSFPRLGQLHVRDTKVTPAGVSAIKKALPNCRID